MTRPAPANDPTNWPDDSLVRVCDCGCRRFFVYLIDGWPRLVCYVCEMDHTEVFFVTRSRPHG